MQKFGRLYTWEAAKAACRSIGMRLPSREEWQALVDYAGGDNVAGKKLKSTSGWRKDGNGTDDFGFSALPGGSRYSGGGFSSAGGSGYWWTATEGGDDNAYHRSMGNDYGNVYEKYYDKDYGDSVRCVENK